MSAERRLTEAEGLALMKAPHKWPLRVVLPLAHATRRDAWGAPECAFIALGHGAKLYLGNVGDFHRGETLQRERFEGALTRFRSLTYVSLEAIAGDGWRVD